MQDKAHLEVQDDIKSMLADLASKGASAQKKMAQEISPEPEAVEMMGEVIISELLSSPEKSTKKVLAFSCDKQQEKAHVFYPNDSGFTMRNHTPRAEYSVENLVSISTRRKKRVLKPASRSTVKKWFVEYMIPVLAFGGLLGFIGAYVMMGSLFVISAIYTLYALYPMKKKVSCLETRYCFRFEDGTFEEVIVSKDI